MASPGSQNTDNQSRPGQILPGLQGSSAGSGTNPRQDSNPDSLRPEGAEPNTAEFDPSYKALSLPRTGARNTRDAIRVSSFELGSFIAKIASRENLSTQDEFTLFECLNGNPFARSDRPLAEKQSLFEKVHRALQKPTTSLELRRGSTEEHFMQFRELVSQRYALIDLGAFLSEKQIISEQTFSQMVKGSNVLVATRTASKFTPEQVDLFKNLHAMPQIQNSATASLIRSLVEERLGFASTQPGSSSNTFQQLLHAATELRPSARRQLIQFYLEYGSKLGASEFSSLLKLTGLDRTGNLKDLSVKLKLSGPESTRAEYVEKVKGLRAGPEVDIASLCGMSNSDYQTLQGLARAHPGSIPASRINYREPSIRQLIESGLDEMKRQTELARREEDLLTLYAVYQLGQRDIAQVMKATSLSPRAAESALLRLEGLITTDENRRLSPTQKQLDQDTLDDARKVMEKYSVNSELAQAEGLALALRALGFHRATVAIVERRDQRSFPVSWQIYY